MCRKQLIRASVIFSSLDRKPKKSYVNITYTEIFFTKYDITKVKISSEHTLLQIHYYNNGSHVVQRIQFRSLWAIIKHSSNTKLDILDFLWQLLNGNTYILLLISNFFSSVCRKLYYVGCLFFHSCDGFEIYLYSNDEKTH